MIRQRPGDLLQVERAGRYYYALVLSRDRAFGGDLVFAFHRASESPLGVAELVRRGSPGFYEFVDFILAKREGRLTRVASKVDCSLFPCPRFFRRPFRAPGGYWIFEDMAGHEIKRTRSPSLEELRVPAIGRILDSLMADRIDQGWLRERDDAA